MRKIWLDYLRVIAIFSVITGHVATDFYVKYHQIERLDWWFSNILDSVIRFSVPIFVMIAGVVHLGRRLPMNEFYKKIIIRLVPAIIFWNFFYILFDIFKGTDLNQIIWSVRYGLLISGFAVSTHLWYLSMFLCLMLFVPFVNKFISGEPLAINDFKIFFCIMIVIYSLNLVAILVYSIKSIEIIWFSTFVWFFAYLIGGYFIDRHGMDFRISNVAICILIIILTSCGIFLNYYIVSNYGILKDYLVFNNSGVLLFALSNLIFLLAKKNSHVFKENNLILKLAEASFGMYLLHPVFIYLFKILFIDHYYTSALIYMPLNIFFAFTMSGLVIILLRKFIFFRYIS